MTIMTTLDEKIQLQAEESFREGLKDFTKEKVVGTNWKLKNKKKMYEAFFDFKRPIGLYDDELALVTKVKNDRIDVC